ncbi:MAG: nucleotidyltransferase domain-containing protein, partial [Candidatus Poribacteria bacterium]|nr:nucleotidyltransferase domain-containing protein [Candidatus Poribacteria bacterium]
MRITQIEPTPSEASPNRIFGQNPQVTDELLDDVVRRILSVGTPLKIVLFGSQARGEAGLNSDLDLLIIEPSNLPRYKRAPRYLRALVGIFPAKDVVVWTPEEIEEWSAVPDAFITTALAEGKILYAREPDPK